MRSYRRVFPVLALAALVASGCFVATGQVLVEFGLTSPFTIDSTTDPFARIFVDLNTIPDYSKHKDSLKGLNDFALIGKFTNLSGPAGALEMWVTPGSTNYTTVAEVQANATKLWGPGTIGAAPDVHVVTWDESSKLFTQDGKDILIHEAKGDGDFTIYAFGTAGSYRVKVEDGFLILVVSAGP